MNNSTPAIRRHFVTLRNAWHEPGSLESEPEFISGLVYLAGDDAPNPRLQDNLHIEYHADESEPFYLRIERSEYLHREPELLERHLGDFALSAGYDVIWPRQFDDEMPDEPVVWTCGGFKHLTSLEALADWLKRFCDFWELPHMSADELAAELPAGHPCIKPLLEFGEHWDAMARDRAAIYS